MLSAVALGSFVLSSFSACSSSFQVSPYGGYYLPLGDSHILYAETEEVDEDIECEVNEESIPLFTALGKEVKDKEENGTKKYYNPTTKTCTDYSSSVDWVDKNFKKFAILNNNTKSFPNFSARKAVGKGFIDYVEKRA